MTMPAATGGGLRNPTGGPSVSYGKAKGGYRPVSINQFTPEQTQLFKSLFGHLGPDSFLGRLAGGDQSQFEELEAPAWRQFQGAQGQLASRFSGGFGNSNALSARKSSGFQNASNQYASEFAQDLQSKRLGIRNEAIQDLLRMSEQLLNQRPNMTGFMQQSPSIWQKLLGGLGGLGTESLPWKSLLGKV